MHPATLFGPGWLWHPLGACAQAGSKAEQVRCLSYNLYSGIVGDFVYLGTLAAILLTAWRTYRRIRPHLECHDETCHRIGWHRVEGTPFRNCWEHHPVLGRYPHHAVPLEHIHKAHKERNR